MLQEFTFSVSTGLNLLGFPIELTPGAHNAVLGHNAFRELLVWAPEGHDLRPDLLRPGRGYWLNAEREVTLDLQGTSPLDTRVVLAAGWNLVSPVVPCKAPRDVPGVIAFFAWDSEAGYTPLLSPTDEREAGSCLPGHGYWVYASEDGVVIWGDVP